MVAGDKRTDSGSEPEGAYDAEEVEIGPDVPDDTAKRALFYEYSFAVLKVVVGLVIVFTGVYLLLAGISGAVALSLELLPFSAEVQTAAIGVVVILLGVALIANAKPLVTLGRRR